jgi:hypothetical protein
MRPTSMGAVMGKAGRRHRHDDLLYDGGVTALFALLGLGGGTVRLRRLMPDILLDDGCCWVFGRWPLKVD